MTQSKGREIQKLHHGESSSRIKVQRSPSEISFPRRRSNMGFEIHGVFFLTQINQRLGHFFGGEVTRFFPPGIPTAALPSSQSCEFSMKLSRKSFRIEPENLRKVSQRGRKRAIKRD